MHFVGSLRIVADDMLEAQRVLQSPIDSAVLVNLSHLARDIERLARQLGIEPEWFPAEA